MTVYVDELVIHANAWGPFRGGSCHMTADTLDELHAMAAAIGMRRSWFQPQSTPHYDLVPSRRARALELGAVFVSAREQARKRLIARGLLER